MASTWSALVESHIRRLTLYHSPEHAQTAASVLRLFRAAIEVHDVAELDGARGQARFEEFLVRRKAQGLAMATLNRDIRYLNQFFSWLGPCDRKHPNKEC